MRVNVVYESKEKRLHEKRTRIKRRSIVGSLTFHSMVSGVTINRISAMKSMAVATKTLRRGIPRRLRQFLWLTLRSYHGPLFDLHTKAEIRRSAAYMRETMMASPYAKRRQTCFSGNILAIDREILKREPLEYDFNMLAGCVKNCGVTKRQSTKSPRQTNLNR